MKSKPERDYGYDAVDKHLDIILKASGSALKHYCFQKTKDDMRNALKDAVKELSKIESDC